MSIRIVCDNCGRVIYSAAAPSLLSAGYRCPCGEVPRIDEPPFGEEPDTPDNDGDGDDLPAA